MILLDTNIVLWLAFEPQRISRDAETAIADSHRDNQPMAICGITLLELTTMSTKGRFRYFTRIEDFLSEIEAAFQVLPITSRACAHVLTLPASYPSDPADRIIGATAIAENLPLITADSAIRRSRAVRTIW